MRRAKQLGIVAVLGALVTVGAVVNGAASARRVDCAAQPGNTVSGVLEGNLEVGTHGTICLITGTVQGNVTVRDESPACANRPPFTAVNVIGGVIEGNVKAEGDRCVMVWLRDGAVVEGNVIYRAKGNLGFLGDSAGAAVHGNALLKDGLFWATGRSATNRVEGNLICNGGQPKEGLGSGSETNWDGADGDLDGSIGGHYLGC